jgi:hypothetical protein
MFVSRKKGDRKELGRREIDRLKEEGQGYRIGL